MVFLFMEKDMRVMEMNMVMSMETRKKAMTSMKAREYSQILTQISLISKVRMT